MTTYPTPLQGLKVLELAGLAPSPFAGLILADYGADVLRVDRPTEVFGPPGDVLCRWKRSVVIDLKSESSRKVFLSLARSADVLINPYRPGVLERLGLGPKDLSDLNPRLIYAQIHGFRPGGFYGQRAGHDINYLAVSGVLSLLGRKNENPLPPVNILADFAGGGLVCVVGILMAVIHRSVSGKGQVVTANMVDGSSYLATFPRLHQGRRNMDAPRGENLLDGAAPFYEVYETKDQRFVAVGAQEPQFYQNLIAGLELPSSFLSEQWNKELWPERKKIIANRFKQKTRHEWRTIFDSTDACVSPVLEFSEIEGSFAPLVELSATPSLDVASQESHPDLKKGEGHRDAISEWCGVDVLQSISVDPQSGVLTLGKSSKL
ncbi:Isopenicillin N epimerase component 2 [Cyphellophora attinorum]|uniref:Isopenicillin N epimerase component 2 n=1 Tax=Cyphellophora attinorum TaxID=1664694 RepID=A0A0N1HM45_9EURO|nr:Isopenicillin N epimerase component 2 [Phialophora attinorum]KPI35760.1 Isopenicillin N epimerase component 2 [Phialophora attinorum]